MRVAGFQKNLNYRRSAIKNRKFEFFEFYFFCNIQMLKTKNMKALEMVGFQKGFELWSCNKN